MAEPARILVIGELNADAIAAGMREPARLGFEVVASDFALTLGSASAIFAVGAQKLGHPTALVSCVGDDELGRFCLRELATGGVDTRYVKRHPRLGTGITLCLSGKKDRAQVTYLGCIAALRRKDVPQQAFLRRRHLHLTSFALQHGLRSSFAALARQARQRRLSVSFDPNADLSGPLAAQARRVMRLCDVVFMNEQEARRFTGTSSAERALATLGQIAPYLVIKLGAKGAMALVGGELYRAPGFRVPAVDTTGAGDSFAAGFISACLRGKDPATCLRWGNAAGALSTRQVGGTPGQPTRSELERLLEKNRHSR